MAGKGTRSQRYREEFRLQAAQRFLLVIMTPQTRRQCVLQTPAGGAKNRLRHHSRHTQDVQIQYLS